MSFEEFLRAGERIFNLKRLYNIREGISRKDDTFPIRILTQWRGSGESSNNLPPLSELLSQYYSFRGWNVMGIPKQKKIIELDLNQEAFFLHK